MATMGQFRRLGLQIAKNRYFTDGIYINNKNKGSCDRAAAHLAPYMPIERPLSRMCPPGDFVAFYLARLA